MGMWRTGPDEALDDDDDDDLWPPSLARPYFRPPPTDDKLILRPNSAPSPPTKYDLWDY